MCVLFAQGFILFHNGCYALVNSIFKAQLAHLMHTGNGGAGRGADLIDQDHGMSILAAQELRAACYGLDGRPPCTQREIAERCGISRSYVSRIEKKALKKLEEAMEQP